MNLSYKNLTIVGTNHIAKDSITNVITTIQTLKPTVVAVELDQQRYLSLTSKSPKKKGRSSYTNIRTVGFSGFLFATLGGWMEKKLGDYVGSSPGTEMLTAISEGKKIQAHLALIDQDITLTLKRFSTHVKKRELFNIVWDGIKSIFITDPILKKIEKKFHINTVPSDEVILELLTLIRKRYPTLYEVLIEERNIIMAKRLFDLKHKNNGRIVAIVGAGHQQAIIKEIKKIEKKHAATTEKSSDPLLSYSVTIE